jgi:hypothetical protein
MASNIQPRKISDGWSPDYNEFEAGDKALKGSDASKLIFGWNPRAYIFADGEKLTLAN